MKKIKEALNLLLQREIILNVTKQDEYYFLELPDYLCLEMLLDISDEAVFYLVGMEDPFPIDAKKAAADVLYAHLLTNNMNLFMTDQPHCHLGRWCLNLNSDTIEEAFDSRGQGSFTYIGGIPSALSAEGMAELMGKIIESYSATRLKMIRFGDLLRQGQRVDYSFVAFENAEPIVTIDPLLQKLLNERAEIGSPSIPTPTSKEAKLYSYMEELYEDLFLNTLAKSEQEFIQRHRENPYPFKTVFNIENDTVTIGFSHGDLIEDPILSFPISIIHEDPEEFDRHCCIAHIIRVVAGDRVYGTFDNPFRALPFDGTANFGLSKAIVNAIEH